MLLWNILPILDLLANFQSKYLLVFRFTFELTTKLIFYWNLKNTEFRRKTWFKFTFKMKTISSLQNDSIKFITGLIRKASLRKESNVFVVEGKR